MSFRAALVDDLRAEASINSIVDTRIFDMFYEFEDFLNSSANSVSKFPAMTVEQDTWERENNLDVHDNLIYASYTVTCYQVVNLSKFKSRSQNVRDEERDKLREVDTLQEAVVNYLIDKRGSLGSYTVLKSHIENVSDGVFESENNREVVTREITYSITFS
jgi:hypothetical protein